MLSCARNSDDDDGDEEQSEVDGNVDYDQKKRFDYDHQHHIMSMVLPDHVPSITEARFHSFQRKAVLSCCIPAVQVNFKQLCVCISHACSDVSIWVDAYC